MSRGVVLAGVAAAVIVVAGVLALRDLVRPPAPRPAVGAGVSPPRTVGAGVSPRRTVGAGVSPRRTPGAGEGGEPSPVGAPASEPGTSAPSPAGHGRPASLRDTQVDGGLVGGASGGGR